MNENDELIIASGWTSARGLPGFPSQQCQDQGDDEHIHEVTPGGHGRPQVFQKSWSSSRVPLKQERS